MLRTAEWMLRAEPPADYDWLNDYFNEAKLAEQEHLADLVAMRMAIDFHDAKHMWAFEQAKNDPSITADQRNALMNNERARKAAYRERMSDG